MADRGRRRTTNSGWTPRAIYDDYLPASSGDGGVPAALRGAPAGLVGDARAAHGSARPRPPVSPAAPDGAAYSARAIGTGRTAPTECRQGGKALSGRRGEPAPLDAMAWDVAALAVSAFYVRTDGADIDSSFPFLIDDYFPVARGGPAQAHARNCASRSRPAWSFSARTECRSAARRNCG